MNFKKWTALVLTGCILMTAASCGKSGKPAKSSSGAKGDSSTVYSMESSASSGSESSADSSLTGGSSFIKGGSSSKKSSSVKPSGSDAASSAAAVKKIAFDQSIYTAPNKIEPAAGMDYNGVKAIYFNSVDYKGKATKVFAYIGYPKSASSSAKVPAVVLLHGGGGTAYPQWVEEWTGRGYAAIALDLEGHIPTKPGAATYTTHADAGPARTGDFNDVTKPLAEQWMYQACSAAIKANSLLRADDKVIASKVGLCGISWGGIVTSITMSQDDRFAFAVPIYGCGHMKETEGYFADVFKYNKTAADLWEPSKWFSLVKMPVLFINDASDKFFSINSTAKSKAAVAGSYMTVLPYLTHGHEPGWGVQESYTFADSVCKGKAGLIKITKEPTESDSSVSYSLPSGITAKSAQLVYSKTAYAFDGNNNCQAVWSTAAATITGNTAKAALPAGTKSFYINIIDSRGLAVSSKHIAIGGTPVNNTNKIVSQSFANETDFKAATTTGNFQDNPLKWGSVPNTVKLSLAGGGVGGGSDSCLMVSGRNAWSDSARIRFMANQIRAGRTYRMTVYLKNGDSSKGLYLTPTLTLYGGSSNSSSPFPSKTEFLPQGCDLGKDNAANKSTWVKYTATFTVAQNTDAGTVTLDGFGGKVQVTGCDLGYVVLEFLFVTPGGNAVLEKCPYYMDNFMVEDMS